MHFQGFCNVGENAAGDQGPGELHGVDDEIAYEPCADSPLVGVRNVLLTPHSAPFTRENFLQMNRAAAQNVALSASERQRAEAKAEAAARALSAQKAEAELYARDRAADMRNLQNRKRGEILKDIQEQIARSAALLVPGTVLRASKR